MIDNSLIQICGDIPLVVVICSDSIFTIFFKRVLKSPATVAGDFKTLLKNIVNIESDQITTTSGISPHIWIKELSITGD